jgi:hypothetical protein
MIKMTAATIHVQIIEFVTGNPKTVNSVGAPDGTSSAADSAGCAFAVAETAAAPTDGLPAVDCDAGCALTPTANIAARSAQTNIIVLNRFT